jgi:hypothetical protein
MLMRQTVRPTSLARIAMLAAACLCASVAPAQAGVMDFLFGGSEKAADASKSGARRRSWSLHEFTTIRLVPRESGAAPNQHPVQLEAEALRQQLAQVRFVVGSGTQALFAADELGELVEPLLEAFANSTPDEDLLLLSTSRRGAGLLSQPLGITARLFVQGGQLQLLVNDARYEFVNEYKGTGKAPQFTFGSRSKAGPVALRSAAGSNQRPDWLAMSTAMPAAPSVATPVAPSIAPSVAPAAAPKTVAPAPAAAAATSAPALRPRDPGYAEEVEQRLLTLKRLRERGLISEEEYQQKRREILQTL